MTKTVIILFSITLLIGCKKYNSKDIFGSWKPIQVSCEGNCEDCVWSEQEGQNQIDHHLKITNHDKETKNEYEISFTYITGTWRYTNNKKALKVSYSESCNENWWEYGCERTFEVVDVDDEILILKQIGDNGTLEMSFNRMD